MMFRRRPTWAERQMRREFCIEHRRTQDKPMGCIEFAIAAVALGAIIVIGIGTTLTP